MIGLVAALGVETQDLRKQMQLQAVRGRKGERFFSGQYRSREILLVQTGMGALRAKAAAEALLGQHPMDHLIGFGFAGALEPGLKPGDLVLCQSLSWVGTAKTTSSCRSDASLLRLAAEAAQETGLPFQVGDSITVATPVADPEAKRQLGKEFGASVVDMEGYWVGRAAEPQGIPFLAVRAVSDGLNQKLPAFDRVTDSQGRWLWREGCLHFLSHPAELAELPGLYVKARLARRNLTQLLLALIPRL